jgi:hypothetical protein
MSSQPTDVNVKLTYLQWQDIYNDTRPYRIAQFGRKRRKNAQPAHNLVFHKGKAEELIRDIRETKEQGAEFSLETNGFVYRKYPSSAMGPRDFWSAELVEKAFLPECEAIIRKEIKGVDQVYIFDWKVNKPYLMVESYLSSLTSILFFRQLRKKKTAKDREAKNRKLLSRARQVHVGE